MYILSWFILEKKNLEFWQLLIGCLGSSIPLLVLVLVYESSSISLWNASLFPYINESNKTEWFDIVQWFDIEMHNLHQDLKMHIARKSANRFFFPDRTPIVDLPTSFDYVPVLWGYGASWQYTSRCSGSSQRPCWTWEYLWVQNRTMWFMRPCYHAEGNGHPCDCCASEELTAHWILLFCSIHLGHSQGICLLKKYSGCLWCFF